MMLKNEKLKRGIAAYLAFSILFSVISPTAAWALTGGPSQAEYESFEPAGASEMVNLFNGDFTYNIPLMDVDGYPINMSYHGGIHPDQEASWVGLGWSLNCGSITRGMRGIPDDFDGDVIDNTINIKPNKIWGINTGGGVEVVGAGGGASASAGLSAGFGITYNNYKGLGIELNFGTTGSLQASYMGAGAGLSAGANLRVSSQDGADFTAAAGLGANIGLGQLISFGGGVNWSATVNSRNGLTENKVGGSKQTGKLFVFGGMQQTEINLVPNTAYTPNLQYPMTFDGFSGDFHAGAQYYWINGHSYNRGFVYEQGLQRRGNNNVRSYGYFNLQNADNSSATDFNRDANGTFYLECPKLPAATLTYDLFNVNAQGLGMLYRPYRNDFGAIYDNFVISSGNTTDLSIETNYGNYGELGINTHNVSSVSSSGKWVSNNQMENTGLVRYRGKNKFALAQSGNTFEPVYFKNMMEYNISDDAFDQKVGNDQLSSFKLVATGGNSSVLSTDLTNGNITSGAFKSKREPRNNNLSFLSVAEATKYGFEKEIINHGLSLTTTGFNSTTTSLNRNLNGTAKNHHISEITVLKEDGARYIFGVPVYNTEFKEVAFNVQGNGYNPDCVNGLIQYSPSSDNSIANDNGTDHFYLGKETPAFAHSFLLSSILSADYVDRKEDGPTSDDFGDFTKFNYSKLSSDYGWRVPYGVNQAIYSKGLLADARDDKGLLMYGRKDIWYMHSIETKNYIAEFHVSARSDAKGVVDENGATANASLYKLDKIVLYSKEEKIIHPTDPTPLKTVHFVYDYFLCPGTPNSNGASYVNSGTTYSQGKLTLKEVFFTYGKSEKGRFNPFKFDYCDADHDGTVSSAEFADYNPPYKRNNIDRWGNYQKYIGIDANCNNGGSALGNDEFPYSQQDKTVADKNAAVWSLTSIKTPAGSKIKVNYEADDYAYIQDQVAGQMVTMVDISNTTPTSVPPLLPSQTLYTGIGSGFDPKDYVVLDLKNINGGIDAGSNNPTPAQQAAANSIFKNQCLPQSGKIYFKAMVALGADANSEQEYVPGYAQIDLQNSGLIFNTPVQGSDGIYRYQYGYIKLKPEDLSDEAVYPGPANPISKAAWQMTRLSHPQIAYPGSEPGSNVIQALVGLLGSLSEVLTFSLKNERLLLKGYAQHINPAKSWVRLNNVSKKKIGGGHRVSRIEIEDVWSSMVASEQSSTYGQTYTYTTTESATGPVISSGVASYEPQLGGDEISLRKPKEYSVNRTYAPNDAHFIEEPIGESFFPPPMVGYSQVTVRNIDHTISQSPSPIPVSNIGKTIYSFYTAKDFPIKVEYNGVDMDHYKPDPVKDLFNAYLEDHVYLTQGFLIKLNDMHGKIKSVLTYQEGQNVPISGITYFYKTKNNGQLENQVPMINASDEIRIESMGRIIDVTADFRMTKTATQANYSNFNLNVSAPLPWPYPIPIPTFFDGVSSDIRSFQSATLTKLVMQQGIVDRVESIDNYSKNTTSNLLWDKETGDVVVTQTTNNFDDPVYGFNYPAYWVNKRMGGAYKNIGISFINVLTSSGFLNVTSGLIQQGDELMLHYLDASSNPIAVTSPEKYWAVIDNNNNLFLMDRDGGIVDVNHPARTNFQPGGTQGYALEVLRSGYRNMLDKEAGDLTSLSNFIGTYNPVPGGPLTASLDLDNQILSASVNEYTDQWNKFCHKEVCGIGSNEANPYVNGSKGNWRSKRAYSYFADRLALNSTNESTIRKDGTFNTFKPFFKYTTSKNAWLPVYNSSRNDYLSTSPFDKWVMNGQVNMVSPYGNVVEVKDAINRHSASLHGYNNTIKTADAVNAKYRQIGFDGFEDYNYWNRVQSSVICESFHFGFIFQDPELVYGIAHTGRYSLMILPNAETFPPIYFTGQSDCVDHFGSNNTGDPPIDPDPDPDPNDPDDGDGGGTEQGIIGNNPAHYVPLRESCKCLSSFSPESDLPYAQKYVVSFWAKESIPNNNGDYTRPALAVSFNNIFLTPVQAVKKTQIINGWQKFDYVYEIPANAGVHPLGISLLNNGGGEVIVYYDDIRVHPFNATMNSYVYDPESLRIWAELDDRNFATIYEYDNEGVMVRVKKETEDGIITIKETRNSFKKQ
ncbi:MAG: hypothetical protein ACT4ON_12585 [Bacteroidota bacterium]